MSIATPESAVGSGIAWVSCQKCHQPSDFRHRPRDIAGDESNTASLSIRAERPRPKLADGKLSSVSN
eukprot:scaffold59201_cov35-Prasinocladus_malaysianus.AAC.1